MIPEAIPFWMRQRQVKAEPAGESAVKLTAPNLPSHELAIEGASPDWKARVYRLPAEGQKILVAEREFAAPGVEAAWQNAYELYRQQVII
jgi:hypothetical protein